MDNRTITAALSRLCPGAEFMVVGDALSGITWLDQVQTQPTDQAVTDEVAVVEAENAAGVYLVNRRAAYLDRGLTIEAMVEALWKKSMEADSTEADDMQTVRDQVHNEFPDPNQA